MATTLCCGKAVTQPSSYLQVTDSADTLMVHRSQLREYLAAGWTAVGELPFSTVPECLWNHESMTHGGDGSGAPAAPAGSLDGISLVSGGSGYVDASYTGVALTGGSGANATADITVSSGVVTAATINAAGTAYTSGNTLSVAAADLGGTGSGLSLNVDTVADGSGGTMSSPVKAYSYGW